LVIIPRYSSQNQLLSNKIAAIPNHKSVHGYKSAAL